MNLEETMQSIREFGDESIGAYGTTIFFSMAASILYAENTSYGDLSQRKKSVYQTT